MAGNGLGPKWFPKSVRRWLTSLGELFFKRAAWEIHDLSYAKGNPTRSECDKGFLMAMLKDASEASTIVKMLACCLLAWLLWILVRLFGWTTFNNYKGIL
jgi:hypothetical protein